APNQRFHGPIHGVDIRQMLRKLGFAVYMIDEYLSPSLCPMDGEQMEKPKTAVNARRYRRRKRPAILCHKLLRYIYIYIILRTSSVSKLTDSDIICTNQNSLESKSHTAGDLSRRPGPRACDIVWSV
ncbi:hypothetical protein BJV82DRAFT_679522, partial [Fennellomyces sp. T-0311]